VYGERLRTHMLLGASRNWTALWLLGASVLVGCVTTSQPSWYHPTATNPQAQFSIDSGQCLAGAYRAVPDPQPVPSVEIDISTTRTVNPYQAYKPFGAVGGLTSGREKRRIEGARQTVYVGCMTQRGWTLSQ